MFNKKLSGIALGSAISIGLYSSFAVHATTQVNSDYPEKASEDETDAQNTKSDEQATLQLNNTEEPAQPIKNKNLRGSSALNLNPVDITKDVIKLVAAATAGCCFSSESKEKEVVKIVTPNEVLENSQRNSDELLEDVRELQKKVNDLTSWSLSNLSYSLISHLIKNIVFDIFVIFVVYYVAASYYNRIGGMAGISEKFLKYFFEDEEGLGGLNKQLFKISLIFNESLLENEINKLFENNTTTINSATETLYKNYYGFNFMEYMIPILSKLVDKNIKPGDKTTLKEFEVMVQTNIDSKFNLKKEILKYYREHTKNLRYNLILNAKYLLENMDKVNVGETIRKRFIEYILEKTKKYLKENKDENFVLKPLINDFVKFLCNKEIKIFVTKQWSKNVGLLNLYELNTVLSKIIYGDEVEVKPVIAEALRLYYSELSENLNSIKASDKKSKEQNQKYIQEKAKAIEEYIESDDFSNECAETKAEKSLESFKEKQGLKNFDLEKYIIKYAYKKFDEEKRSLKDLTHYIEENFNKISFEDVVSYFQEYCVNAVSSVDDIMYTAQMNIESKNNTSGIAGFICDPMNKILVTAMSLVTDLVKSITSAVNGKILSINKKEDL